ncbi:anaerobic glycerol-3-phosphate dehydrogenase subunit C [Candidatus Chloroploca asiatica]|uniref:sn-glycerol-3-phosphate dehydrogenase subunit C n=1 Tax=Candidatus Chloroploca asiatica TaxID=1506545 RepID=A0A2H3L5V7_9CHLR|nr:anaerobic glycerol-3-phosphate dehydrogenase subunit C [Candidatus Chloroploca asiatica]PDW00341.1 sn-glycerol-3-phosphate dehydrogenase subunit C [Candidatus Chloroploca asiatica]
MDHIELSLTQSLDHCIKCNICTSACPVAAVTDAFPGPKYVGPQAQRFRHEGQPVPDASVDYCSGCRVCNQVCPTGVKIAELNARARAQIVAERGLPFRNWLVARAGLVGRMSCGPHAPLLNFGLRLAPARWAVEKVIGIHRKAPLPASSTYTFRAWFRKHRAPTTARRQVAFFHGCATNFYEPHVGKAAIAVLEHNGFEVLLPKQQCCGLPLISNGDFKAATSAHEANVQALVSYARQGIPIVGTSTSCTLTLKEEAPEILALHSEDVQAVAAGTYDIFEFLRSLAERGELKTDFRPIERHLPYHQPCQYRAHRLGSPAMDVLSLIPGLVLEESHAECCGIAGTYGLKQEKYQIGMDVGAKLFAMVKRSGSDLALCDSETCRWQITHGTGVASKHPIEILAEAYGLEL